MSAKPATPAKKVAKPKKPADHPPVAEMVTAAINNLKERNGSSLAAIKKYIAAHYMCDVPKLAPFIRRFLKKGVADGKLKQIKASYKIDKGKVEKPKKPVTTPKKADKPKKKATAKPKKAKTPRKAAKPKKAENPKKAKSPKKKAAVKPKKTHKKIAKKVAKK